MYRDWEFFKPEQFTLDPRAEGFELDQEVAATLTNVVFNRDEEGQTGNRWAGLKLIVDPTGQSETHGHRDASPGNEEAAAEGYRISLNAADTTAPNQLFTREVQKALFEGERANRMGFKWSLGMSAVMFAMIEGAPTVAAVETNLSTWAKIGLYASANGLFGPMLKPIPEHWYRLNVVKPGTYLNERHLRAAEELGKTLLLSPVVRN